MYAVQDKVYAETPSLWCFTWTVCANVGYKECFGRTSEHYAPPSWKSSQHCRIFIPQSVSLWNDLGDPVFDGVGLAGLKRMANAFLLA